MHSEDRGLVVSGSVDRESDEGQGVWTAIKSGVASFSIGFLATKSRPREGGGRDLLVIDLLEVSVVTKPMHPATRTLGWKSAETGADWEAIKAAERKAEAVHQKAQKDREFELEVDAILAKAETKRAKERKRSRPIKVARFRV